MLYGIAWTKDEVGRMRNLVEFVKANDPETYEDFAADAEANDEEQSPETFLAWTGLGGGCLDAYLVSLLNKKYFQGEDILIDYDDPDAMAEGIFLQSRFPWNCPEVLKTYTKADADDLFQTINRELCGCPDCFVIEEYSESK